jgi:hypothetical protein
MTLPHEDRSALALVFVWSAYRPIAVGSRTLWRCPSRAKSCHNGITTGDVVDVEFVLGEKPAPKMSERFPEGMPAPERIHAEGRRKPPWVPTPR